MESGNEVDGEEQEEEVEGEEEESPPLLFYVPYIHNGYILEYLSQYGNAATADMLLELPLCPQNDRGSISAYVTKLKSKRETLRKKRSKSVEDGNVFQRFLDAEFSFPIPSKTTRYKILLVQLIKYVTETDDETTHFDNDNNNGDNNNDDDKCLNIFH